uniref:TSA: Wollemia nobilis Ref_Wollemi_Transcript_25423_1090 transcribed RNA sequence n=1 Tax=Wollemia nobilis TaxID=56998 RepID=A0A0C9QM03_9CONI
MASSSTALKLSRSFSRIIGLSSRVSATGGSSRGFATYELSDKDKSEEDVSSEDESSGKSQYSKDASKFKGSTVQDLNDVGLYRAIILGEVGQVPIQKRLRNGRVVTIFSVGTGGIRNNRRPLENESPREYADRGIVQWHRVAIYVENLGGIAMQHMKQGAHVYLEGNLETKIFSDPLTGIVKRIREIAIRQKGRLVFLNNGTEATDTNSEGLKGVGYF